MDAATKPKNARAGRRPQRFLAWFALYITAFTIASAAVVDHQLALRFPQGAKFVRAYEKLDGPAVLGVGSSRMEAIFNVSRMTAYLRRTIPDRSLTAFCAAAHGGGPVSFEAIINDALQSRAKPDLLVLETGVDFFDNNNWWIKAGRDLTWWNAAEVIPDLLTPNEKRGFEEFPRRCVVENRLLPVYSRRFNVRLETWRWVHARLGREAPPLDPLEPVIWPAVVDFKPDTPAPPPMTDKLRELQERCAVPLHRFHATGSAARAVVRILQRCEKLGVPVVLLDAPVSSPLGRVYEPVQAQYHEFIDALLARFPGVRFFDCRNTLPDNAFCDDHHVNLYGQDVICHRLADQVIPDTLASWRRSPPVNGVAHANQTPVVK